MSTFCCLKILWREGKGMAAKGEAGGIQLCISRQLGGYHIVKSGFDSSQVLSISFMSSMVKGLAR